MSADPARQPLFGLAAEFGTPEAILQAARRIGELGYTRAEAYTPQPVEELAEVLGMRRTYVAPVVLAAAVLGGITGFGMQWFASVIHYPLNVGGKPLNSWPMFIPITFELAILFAAVTGVIAMLVLNRLPQPYHPMFRLERFGLASRDGFFLCIESSDPRFDPTRTRKMLEALEPLAVMEVPW